MRVHCGIFHSLSALFFVSVVSGRPASTAIHINNRSKLLPSYDYIIAGGGTAGLTVADRLTEDPNITVLVIEHGAFPADEPAVTIPGLLDLSTTPYRFPLTSEPIEGLANRSFDILAGRGVGGSTLINGMFFDRGTASDYDDWAALGNTDPVWSWDALLPYFKKSETFTPPDGQFAEEWGIAWNENMHGTEGPVQSSFPVYQFEGIKNWMRAWMSLGWRGLYDPTEGLKNGVVWNPSSLDYENQSRSHAGIAHWERVRNERPNYHVLPMHAVSRVLLVGRKTVGVEYFSTAKNETGSWQVKAGEEVILAAGTYNSLKILQLSGIGPRSVLTTVGVDVAVDLPGVGYNLQDHPSLFTVWKYSSPTWPTPDDLESNQTLEGEALQQYEELRTGPLTVVRFGGNSVVFLPLSSISGDSSSVIAMAENTLATTVYPEDASAAVVNGYHAQKRLIVSQLGRNNTSVQEAGFNAAGVVPITLLKPLSRGTVLINSTNPRDQAVVNYGTFKAPSDIAILTAAIRKNRQAMFADTMLKMGTSEIVPGISVQSDSEFEKLLRQQATPAYQHPVGTCAMMPQQLGGVVDSRLRVYGIQGLRVVDASSIPIVPSAHTSATVYAVAERAAQLIKEDRFSWFSSGVTAE